MRFRIYVCVFCCSSTLGLAGVDQLTLTEVDPIANTVEVTHFDSVFYTNTALRSFCHQFSYGPSIGVGEVFGPGESKVYSVPLDDTVSDIWLYRTSSLGGFNDAANIISGMKYGSSAQVGRESLAASVGLWPSASAFVPAPEPAESLQLRDEDPTQVEHWVSAHPTPIAFFVLSDVLADIPMSSVTVGLREVASGLVAPVGVHSARDGSGRLFILDQAGLIRILKDGVLLPTAFLDVTAQLFPLSASYDERGLLGLAFHPDFATNGKLYTYQSQPVSGTPDFTSGGPANHHGVVSEWQVSAGDSNVVNLASKRDVMRVNQPQSNHNGGELAFGQDGLLYIALGDGGGSDDSAAGHGALGNGQNAGNVLGAILRIDVDGSDSANGQYGIPTNNPFVASAEVDEIFAYGFRNPYRFSFDQVTGDLYAGDVGQNHVEEVDLVTAGKNYGWRFKEGSFFFNHNPSGGGFPSSIPVDPVPAGAVTDPIAEYDHGDGISVIGGYVYRGTSIPALAGRYVFGDFGSSFNSPSGFLLMLDSANRVSRLRIGTDNRALGLWVKGFGQDDRGEVYVCASTVLGPSGSGGVVLKLIPLVGIEASTVDGFGATVDIVRDSSISTLAVESSVDLTDTNGWSGAGGSIAPLGPGLDRATLPAPGAEAGAFRVIGTD